MKRIVRLTEADLTRLVKRVIEEQNSYPKKDPKRIAYFDSLAKQISSALVGKKLFFGNIGTLKDQSILIDEYWWRKPQVNLEGTVVKDFWVMFNVTKTQENLFPNKFSTSNPSQVIKPSSPVPDDDWYRNIPYYEPSDIKTPRYRTPKNQSRPWEGTLIIQSNFVDGKLQGNPDVKLYAGKSGRYTTNSEMTPTKPWTWDMVGGANLWAKAANPPK